MSRDRTIAQLTALAGSDLAAGDSFVVYDASAPSNQWTKRIAASELASALGNLGTAVITPFAYGFTGSSSASDSAAIASAAAAADTAASLLYFPPGYTYTTLATIDLGANTSVWIPAGATVKAGAAIAAVFRTPLSTVANNRAIFGQGVVDCNFLANIGLHPRYFARFSISDLTVLNCLVTNIQVGEAGMPSTSYELIMRNVKGNRTTGSNAPSGSRGLWISHASDCKVAQTVMVGTETGFRVDTSNNDFCQLHAWSYTPSTGDMECCFDDNGFNNRWVECYADTPSASASRLSGGVVPYGFRFRNDPGATVIAPTCYNNNLNGLDNTSVAIRFDTAAPFATIIGRNIKGADASHRWAKDIDINGSDESNLTLVGIQSSQVVTATSPDRLRATVRAAGDVSCTRLQIPATTGTNVTGFALYTPTLTPASVAAATVAEQTFTVNGLTTKDNVILSPPAISNATGIAGWRVSAANTLAIRFSNPTAGALTPTSGTYTIFAIRTP